MNAYSRVTPLYEEHLRLSARMTEFAGWQLPLSYPPGTLKEHEAVRGELGIFDVSHMGRVILRGEETERCLEYLTPTALTPLKPGRAKYTVLLNERGGVVDDLILYKVSPSEYRIIWNAANHGKNLTHMKPFLERFSLTLYDETQESALIALQGPHALATLERLGLPVPPARFSFITATFLGSELFLSRTGYTGEEGVELWVPRARAPELWRMLLKEGATPCGLAARDSLRIEAGLPLYGHELHEDLDPASGGIGFVLTPGKGDFLGSRALQARITPHPPFQLFGIVALGKGIPRQGYPVYLEGKEIPGATVTSGSYSPILKRGIGLVRFPFGSVGVGARIELAIRGAREPFLVLKPPLHRSFLEEKLPEVLPAS